MVRRRVQSQMPIGETQNFNQADVLNNLGTLAQVATLLRGEQGLEDVPDLRGTAQEQFFDEGVDFPQTPSNPELYEDQPGVDDVPGIPEGIELLGDLAGYEGQEDALDAVSETAPPDISQGDDMLAAGIPGKGIMGAISDYFSPSKRVEMSDRNQQLFDRNERRQQMSQEPEMLEEVQDEVQAEVPQPVDEVSTEIQEEVVGPELPPAVEMVLQQPTKEPESIQESDIPSEGLEPVEGMVEQAKIDPQYKQVLERFFNVKSGQLPNEVIDWAEKTQNALNKEIEELDETEKGIVERLEGGQATMLDKIALGIALATPVIMGLMYGKGAFFSALEGGAKSLAGSMKEGEKERLGLKDKLGTLRKDKRSLLQKKNDLIKEISKEVENPALRKLLKNYDLINVVQDEDGQVAVVPGKDAEIFSQGEFGIKVPGEAGEALYYDANNLRDDADEKTFKSAIKEGSQEYQSFKNANRVIGNVSTLMERIKQQHPTQYDAIAQYIQPSEDGVLDVIFPDSAKTLSIDVVDEDGKITKVRALPLLKHYVTALQDVYNKEYLSGNRLTEAVLTHWRDVFPDPTSIKGWLTSDFNTMLQQAKTFQDTLNNRAVDTLVGQGFLREPLENALPRTEMNILASDLVDRKTRSSVIANPQEAKKKVRKK